jgi:hypothetical protein
LRLSRPTSDWLVVGFEVLAGHVFSLGMRCWLGVFLAREPGAGWELESNISITAEMVPECEVNGNRKQDIKSGESGGVHRFACQHVDFCIDQNVLRFHVPMRNLLLLVNVVQCMAQGHQQLPNPLLRDPLVLLNVRIDQFHQARPLHELHDNVERLPAAAPSARSGE